MNATNSTLEGMLSPGGYLATGIYVMIIGLTGTLGNIIVILVILKYWSKTNISRKPHLPMTLSLALSDLGITFFGYPYTSISGYAGRWMFNDNVCLMAGFSCFFLSMASLDVLVAISVYRYIVICKPEFKTRLCYRTTAWVLVVCWVYAFIWSAPPLFGISGYTYEPFGTACSMDWDSRRPVDITFLIGTDVFCFLMHLVILVFCYTKIFLRYRYLTRPADVNLGKALISREMRVTWMSFTTVMAFVIVWSPYAIACTWMVISDSFPKEYSTLPTMFAKSSCAFNPILYGAFDKQFRQVAKRIVCPWMFRHVNPSKTQVGYQAKYPRDDSIFCTGIPVNNYETDRQLKTISSGVLEAISYADSVGKTDNSARFDFDKFKKRNIRKKCLSSTPTGHDSSQIVDVNSTSKLASFVHHPECTEEVETQKTKNLQTKSMEICHCPPDVNIEGLSVQLQNNGHLGSVGLLDLDKCTVDKRNMGFSLLDEPYGQRPTPRPRLKTKSLSLSNMTLKLRGLNSTISRRKYSLEVSPNNSEHVPNDFQETSGRASGKFSTVPSESLTDVPKNAESCRKQSGSCQPNVADFVNEIKATENCLTEDNYFNRNPVNYLWRPRMSLGARMSPRMSPMPPRMSPRMSLGATARPSLPEIRKQRFTKSLSLANIVGGQQAKVQQIMKRSYNLCKDVE